MCRVDEVRKYRETALMWTPDKRLISSLPVPDETKKAVLEWFAIQLWRILVELKLLSSFGKINDPLYINDDNTAFSTVFDLGSGARWHDFDGLDDLSEQLVEAVVDRIEQVMSALNTIMYAVAKLDTRNGCPFCGTENHTNSCVVPLAQFVEEFYEYNS